MTVDRQLVEVRQRWSNSDPSYKQMTKALHKRNRFFPGKAIVAVALAVALYGILRWVDEHATPRWVSVQGSLEGTRIVSEPWSGIAGRSLLWRAEYKVVYSVAGRKYVIWSDSGIKGESEDEIRLTLSARHSSCRVQYDPSKPESSAAVCQ